MTSARGLLSSRRRPLVFTGVATALATFVVFRVADGLGLVPAGAEAAAVLRLVAALGAGIAVFAAPLFPGRLPAARRLRLLVPVWLVAGATLLVLHGLFVVAVEYRGERQGSVIAFSPPCVEGSEVECTGSSPKACVEALGYREELIEECWGNGRIRAVELVLALSTLVFSGGFGGVVGLLLARRTDVGARPLRLFICYRRADSGAVVEVLAGRLSERFGAGNVFRDVDDIRLGVDFRQAVRQALSGCDAFLLMIGPQWLDARGADGARRLDRADDPVRIEVETAIARGLLIVPVLVGGAAMPRSDQMPDGFEELSNRAGAALLGDPGSPDDPAFNASVDALVRQLGQGTDAEA